MTAGTPLAYLFPGQGSQHAGMGRALAERYPTARAVFAEADAELGVGLSRLCWEGPDELLTETFNAQPAILTHSVAVLRVLAEAGAPHPDYVAGHSLGEYSALVAAESLAFGDAVRLVRERGRLMQSAGARTPGGMAAVLGLERAALDEVCAEASAASGAVVQVANDNCPGQLVISGARSALERAAELARARGARRVVVLPVSIAAHSALMRPAAEAFAAAVAGTPIQAPRIPVIGNVDAAPLADVPAIREELVAQLTAAVRWTASVRALRAAGVERFVEIGPKDVLTGLLKRIDPEARGLAVGEPEQLALALA
jgi:[acyl-carrier-protein] S-malonyltransferase